MSRTTPGARSISSRTTSTGRTGCSVAEHALRGRERRDGDGTVFVFSAATAGPRGTMSATTASRTPRRSPWPRPRPMARSPLLHPERSGPGRHQEVDDDHRPARRAWLQLGDYTSFTGTGHGPAVSGVVALMLEANPELVPGRTEDSRHAGTPTTRRSGRSTGRLVLDGVAFQR